MAQTFFCLTRCWPNILLIKQLLFRGIFTHTRMTHFQIIFVNLFIQCSVFVLIGKNIFLNSWYLFWLFCCWRGWTICFFFSFFYFPFFFLLLLFLFLLLFCVLISIFRVVSWSILALLKILILLKLIVSLWTVDLFHNAGWLIQFDINI